MRVDPEPPPFAADAPLVRSALAWATVQGPLGSHSVEVASLLSERGYDEEVIAAGVLHDVIEDTDARREDVSEAFGERVAGIVAAVSEDERIAGYDARKAALRAQVARAGAEAHAVFAADKLARARELRASGRTAPDRLAHYEASLRLLQQVAPRLPLVHQLALELWALRALPAGSGVRAAAQG